MGRVRSFLPARRHSRGVSLIEAVVALAVMGFGMLGVVALQASLRLNADISKQRTEATRLAHEALESRRQFTAMTATAGQLAWTDLTTLGEESITNPKFNATFKRTVTVVDVTSTRAKNIIVDVNWEDRTGVTQNVRLVSAATGAMPELGMTLGVPPLGGGKVRQPRGRHAAIPPAAVDQTDGTSKFFPPGAGSTYWVFNNSTGYIEKTCTAPAVCTTVYLRLVSGFVSFSTGSTQPTTAMAEAPSSPAFALDVYVDVTATLPTTTTCFKDVQVTTISYFCAVAVDPLNGSKWSGQVYLDGGSLNISSSISDDNNGHHKVCRYTPVRNCQPAVGSVIWGAPNATASCSGVDPTPSRKLTNEEHPLNYLNVTESLANQNFLVIRAGDGSTPFECPADDTGTTLIQSNTWHHQPSS